MRLHNVAIWIGAALLAGALYADAPPAGPKPPMGPPDSALSARALKEVGGEYSLKVEPILKKACFDCHSAQTVFPWYHHIPGVGMWLDGHVREAREHLDLEGGFPFKSEKPIVRRIRGIGGTIKRGSMPLKPYLWMHPDARLSDADKQTVIDWSTNSFEKLSKTAKR